MRAYLEQHFTHPEPASVGPDGQPCGRDTRGVLLAQPIRVTGQVLVGKETNRLREVRVGWRRREEERQDFSPAEDPIGQALSILGDAPDAWLRSHGVDPRSVRKLRARAGAGVRTSLARRVEQAATAFAREALAEWGVTVPGTPAGARSAYVEQRGERGASGGSPDPASGAGRRSRGARRPGARPAGGSPGGSDP